MLRAAVVAMVAAVVAVVLGNACGGAGRESADTPTTTTVPVTTSPSTTSTTGRLTPSAPAPVGRANGVQSVQAPKDASWIATVVGPEVAVYGQPEAPEPLHRLANPNAQGTERVLLVVRTPTRGPWLQVYVPARPNGSQGWVRASDVTLAPNLYRIKISSTAHTLTITSGKQVVMETAIGLGAERTPTPQGQFFVKELIQPTNPYGAYGPYVYGLSAFSETPGLENFNGGDGTIGIHGTNDRSSIGANVSHGCIRVPNEVITQMVSIVPLGTPVEILP